MCVCVCVCVCVCTGQYISACVDFRTWNQIEELQTDTLRLNSLHPISGENCMYVLLFYPTLRCRGTLSLPNCPYKTLDLSFPSSGLGPAR